MAYQITTHTDLPVLSNVLGENLEPGELESMTVETNAALDGLDHKVYFVVDMSKTKMTFEDVVAGASAGARGLKPPLHYPNVIETIIITNDNLVRMAIQGITSPLFGSVRIRSATSLDEALAYIRTASSEAS